MFWLFCKGMLLGASIAMPVGPIGILCIGNVVNFGMRYGLMTGLGAAFADMLYGSLAGFGLTAILQFMVSGASYFKKSLHTTWLNRISGTGLFGFGCVAISG